MGRRERRVVGEPTEQRLGEGEDRAARDEFPARVDNRHPRVVVQRENDMSQAHPVAESTSEALGKLLRAADEADALGRADQRVVVAADPADRREQVKQRDLTRLLPVDGADGQRAEVATLLGLHMLGHPLPDRLPIPRPSLGCRPRSGRGHRARHGVERLDHACQVGKGRRDRRRDVTLVTLKGAAAEVDTVSVPVGGERRDPEFACERHHLVLPRPGPLTAELDHLAPSDPVVEVPSAHPVAGFEHDHAASRLVQAARRGQTGQTGADDGDIVDMTRAARPGRSRLSEERRTAGGGAAHEKPASVDLAHAHVAMIWRAGGRPPGAYGLAPLTESPRCAPPHPRRPPVACRPPPRARSNGRPAQREPRPPEARR